VLVTGLPPAHRKEPARADIDLVTGTSGRFPAHCRRVQGLCRDRSAATRPYGSSTATPRRTCCAAWPVPTREGRPPGALSPRPDGSAAPGPGAGENFIRRTPRGAISCAQGAGGRRCA
jgi:hypothetical protein